MAVYFNQKNAGLPIYSIFAVRHKDHVFRICWQALKKKTLFPMKPRSTSGRSNAGYNNDTKQMQIHPDAMVHTFSKGENPCFFSTVCFFLKWDVTRPGRDHWQEITRFAKKSAPKGTILFNISRKTAFLSERRR